MPQDLVQKYGGQRVPRYTSYPTSPHFTDAVDAAVYAQWLEALPGGRSASLYLHIPFCRTLCWYCGCHTKIVAHDDPIQQYVDALRTEIEIVSERIPGKLRADCIHFGGGTPTILQPAAFRGIMDLLRSRFDIAPDAEIAIEIDPRRLTADMVHTLAETGVNRASLGVQSFDPVVQAAINRIQSFEQTQWAAETLRAAGIQSVNVDLIYGLPLQDISSCERTAAQALELKPDRLSVFGYAHLPSLKAHQQRINEETLPDAQERLQQFDAIATVLVDAAYVQIGLDHFARPEDKLARCMADGSVRRNFQGYTTDQSDLLIGFGASAVGLLPQGYVQNTTSIRAYCAAMAEGKLASAKGIVLSCEDKLRASVIAQIMCRYRVDLDETAICFGFPSDFLFSEREQMRDLEADELVRLNGWTLEVPVAARPWVRSVAAVFDAYLDRAVHRHSSAV